MVYAEQQLALQNKYLAEIRSGGPLKESLLSAWFLNGWERAVFSRKTMFLILSAKKQNQLISRWVFAFKRFVKSNTH